MQKKALLIGIDDYIPIGKNYGDLEGCVNDAWDMAETLHSFGFSLKFLANRKATKQNINTYLRWLISEAKEGDSLVFFYAGHGTRVYDQFQGDEEDTYDEGVLTFERECILDDDFRAIFKELSDDVNLEVIFDCCFAGTGTRMLIDSSDKEDNKRKVRFQEFSTDSSFFIENIQTLKRKTMFGEALSNGMRDIDADNNMNHVLWAGCKDCQQSEERLIGGKVRGVFTYPFAKILREYRGNISREQLIAKVCDYIRNKDYGQTPQLEGNSKKMSGIIFS